MKEQKKYREALQNRSITPTENSWEQLSKQLDAHENIQKSNKWSFLKYAASILLLVSASLFFFQPKEVIIKTPIIETPALEDNVKIISEINPESVIEIVENSKSSVKTPSIKQPLKIAKNEIQIEVISVQNTSEILVNETIIEDDFETVSIASKEINLDNEVEQLLNNAKTNQILNREKVISANTLLTEVEDDLDKDFKDKLIDNILTTLKKPRIVITDRDN
jgi:hypothetical protein